MDIDTLFIKMCSHLEINTNVHEDTLIHLRLDFIFMFSRNFNLSTLSQVIDTYKDIFKKIFIDDGGFKELQRSFKFTLHSLKYAYKRTERKSAI